MGILDKNGWDIFCSYARLDNDLHHNWIKNFANDLKRRVQLLLSDNGFKFDLDELGFFFDTEGMPANGPLAEELVEKIKASHFLFLFVGRHYLKSQWCGDELTWFSQRFARIREAALKNVFVLILTPEALRESASPRLEEIKREGIFQLAFTPDGKEPMPAQLADAQSVLRANPDYVRLVDKLANTLANRLSEILQNRGRQPIRENRPVAANGSGLSAVAKSPRRPKHASPVSGSEIVAAPAEITDQSRPLILPPSAAADQILLDFVRAFPPGPPVPYYAFPRAIRERLHLIKGAAANRTVQDANALRKAISPELSDSSILIVNDPDIGGGSDEFWHKVLGEATLKGPQMTVALLLGLPRQVLDGLDEVVSNFLHSLLKMRR